MAVQSPIDTTGIVKATQAQAEAGTADNVYMTPLKTAQATAADANLAKLDVLQTFTAAQRPTVTALSWSTNTATPTLDTSNDFSADLETAQANTIANPSDIDAGCIGQTGDFVITQDATTASTLAWGSYYLDTAAVAFADAIGTTLSSVTTYNYRVISATHIELIKVGTVA